MLVSHMRHSEIYMSNSYVSQLLTANPIFSSLSKETADRLSSDPRCFLVSAKCGHNVLSDESIPPALGLILSGTVLVYRKGGGLPILLQRLEEGKLFGSSTLFSDNCDYVTELKAECDCSIFFIPTVIVRELINASPQFSLDYISFLSGRIRFLNERISELSAPSTVQKLAAFLLKGNESIAPSKVQLASALGIGRASLYRALDELCEKGLIRLDGKTVEITDRDGLSKLI